MRNEGSISVDRRLPEGVGYGGLNPTNRGVVAPISSEIVTPNPLQSPTNRGAIVDWPGTARAMATQLSISHQNCISQEALESALDERDSRWRKHERSQIAFMQNEHSTMLADLHDQIIKLQHKCAEATTDKIDREQGRSKSTSRIEEITQDDLNDQIKLKLQQAGIDVASLKEIVISKSSKIHQLENQLKETEERQRFEDHEIYRKLRDLEDELREKTSLVSQLTSQIHQLKLKEAVDKHNLRSVSIPRPTGGAGGVHLPVIRSRPNSAVVSTTVTVQQKPLHPASSRYIRYESGISGRYENRHVPRSQSAVLPLINNECDLGTEKQTTSNAQQLQRNQQRSSLRRLSRGLSDLKEHQKP